MEHLSKENNPQVQENNPQVLKVLEVLKQASHDLQTHHSPKSDEPTSPAIKALLELETESDSILSTDTNLSALSHLLSNLKTQVETLHKTRGHSLRSFLTRRASIHSISRLAGSIESEIQAWIDRESIENLSRALQDPSTNDGKLIMLLTQFETRVSQGFNRELQDLILKSKLFALLESTLCNAKTPKHVREYSAFAIAALIRFNKDVFVGQVLMGSAIRALVTMASSSSITVLCSLIKSIKSPLVDEIEFNGEIPKIINFLNSEELEIRIAAMDCVLEMGYYGRKEAVEAMIEEGLIKKLVELQRSELGGDLIDDIGQFEERDSREVNVNGVEGKKVSVFERHPFASCVARFAVQLEVGEGLRQREKRAFKQEILKRVREASLSDAEAATIAAEVLWGSSP